jgi:ParB-like chromosome segregation protein Spo0J
VQATLPAEVKYIDKYPVEKLPSAYPTIPPTPQMVDSIRRFGNFQPIVLAGKRLVCGRRRLDAARQAKVPTVRALVFPDDWADDEIIALVENTQRRGNPVNELHQVESLLKKEFSYDKIRAETGMTQQTLDKLLLIRDKLIKPLRRALEDHLIGMGTAEACAKKSPVVQQRLLDLLEEQGRLTKKDVERATKTEKKQTVAALPDDLFGSVTGTNWRARFKELIAEAKEVAGENGNKEGLELLDQVLQSI